MRASTKAVLFTAAALVANSACSDPGPHLIGTASPDEDVYAMLGNWSYEAEFRLPRLFSSDTLTCTVREARREMTEPIPPTADQSNGSVRRDGPWYLAARLSSGSLACSGTQTPSFTHELAGTQVVAFRTLLCAIMRFETRTPVGLVGVRNETCGITTLDEVLGGVEMRGRTSATDDPRYLDQPYAPPGRFTARKG